jgi:integrase
MGSVRKRPTGSWEARWYDAEGKQHSRNFKTKGDASRHIQAMEGAKVRGDYLDHRLGKTLFRTVAEEWLKTTVRLKPKTRVGYESILKTHLLPAFGGTPVARIDAARIAKFVAEMDVSPGTAGNVLRVLGPLMQHAVKARMIPRNPVPEANRPKVQRQHGGESLQVLTPQQVADVANEVGDSYRTLVLFAAYTGLRAGEIMALRVRDVNPLLRRVTVRESVSDVNGHLLIVTPQNGRTRTLPLAAFLVEPLERQMTGKTPDEFLFGNGTDRPLRHGNFYGRHFKPAVRRALPAELHSLRFHDLRHTCASLLIHEGMHPLAVSRYLGHSSIQITMDRYGHLFPDEQDRLADALDRAYAAVTG